MVLAHIHCCSAGADEVAVVAVVAEAVAAEWDAWEAVGEVVEGAAGTAVVFAGAGFGAGNSPVDSVVVVETEVATDTGSAEQSLAAAR